MVINLEKPEKNGTEKEPILTAATKKEIGELYSEFENLELPAADSQGFLHFDRKDILIDPQNRMIVFRQPEKPKGHDKYPKRDEFEQSWPGQKEDILAWAAKENAIYKGTTSPAAEHPELGGRVCLSVVNIYKTAGGEYMSVPVLPAEEATHKIKQKYAGGAKIAAATLVRGIDPLQKNLLKAAASRETHNLAEIQKKNRQEKIVSRPHIRETGFWTVRFFRDKNGREEYSDVRNVHPYRDPETGTLELLLMREEFILDKFDEFRPQLNLQPGLKRVNTLVSVDKLKKTKEGEALEIERLYFDNELIAGLNELPKNYHGLFSQAENGRFYLNNLHPVPPLRAFLDLQKMMVDETDKDVVNPVREKIGELFEKLMEKALGKEKNPDDFEVALPAREKLKKIVANQPREFQDWALGLKGNKIKTHPDFVLGDGTFIEVKAGGKLEFKPEKRGQLFRMILYKLLKGEEVKVRILTLEKTAQDPAFDWLKYENVFETEWKDKISERDMKPIRMWQRYLPK